MPAPAFETPRLIADIGATYARFALETAPGTFEQRVSLRCADHEDFAAAVGAYLATLPAPTIEHAAVAIANPVEGDHVRMTNYHWEFSIERMRQRLGLHTLVVVNDFTALAMAIPRLAPAETRQVGGGCARERSVIGVIGPGSGLGVSGLIPSDHGWVSLGTEGGHASFSPSDERELAIFEHARRQYAHVSFERLLSGPGLGLIHQALCRLAGEPAPVLTAPEIDQRALAGDARCAEAIEAFCCMLGTAASNLAVTLGALGGIFIGGGIVPRLGERFDRSGFRARFEAKGRFSDYVAAIPTHVITAPHATFVGASAILEAQVRRLATSGGGLLERLRRARAELPRAEQRVADLVLERPRQVLNAPIADIARMADVSQPTVIRFCRSVGCEGLSDFKLRLASGLSGTVPITHSQVRHDDSVLELGVKVLDNTASSILQLRDQLNPEALDRAIALLSGCRRVEFHSSGHFSVVAQDAQFKFLRFGIPSATYTDARLQQLAAAVLGEGDVMVVISPSGRIPELLAAADTALARGASVVALTASQSPLARKASVLLAVEHSDDPQTQMPMVSRILDLLLIDILAVGVSMRRGGPAAPVPGTEEPEVATLRDNAEPAPEAAAEPIRRPAAPGVATAVPPLARLTSHGR